MPKISHIVPGQLTHAILGIDFSNTG